MVTDSICAASRSALLGVILGVLSLGVSASAYASEPQTLSDLIRAGERDAALAAITSPDIDVNAADPDGSTPLMWATYTVDHEMVRALLKKGAKARVSNHFGSSPLEEAVKVADADMVRMLLDAGADPESPNPDGQTALMLASSVGSLPIAQMLIVHGASVNTVERFRHQTALMWAAAENHPDLVDLLLKHGASKEINLRAKYDDWPRQITSEPRAQFRQGGGFTALLYATRARCYRCAVSLVKAGADIEQPNPEGITPLLNALDNRAWDIAMFLLDRGANPGAWDMYGRTPLYVAVDMNSFTGPWGFGPPDLSFGHQPDRDPPPPGKFKGMDVVNRLLAMGVDPNHQLTRMRPTTNGRGRFADYMLRGGAGPLLVATLSYDDVAIKALLAHGAEPDLPNVFRLTPLMLAAGSNDEIRIMQRKQPDLQARAIKVVDLLLDAGANVNYRVTDSHTHTAQVAGRRGAEAEGQTALMAAARLGWDQMVKHLLERGADPTLRDATGKTALDFARIPAPEVGERPGPADPGRAATVKLLAAAAPKS